MKKSIIAVACVLLLVYVIGNKNTGPYSGVYVLKQNPNIVLKMKDNNTFTIDITMGKGSESVKGKYTVNDNKIVLVPDENDWNKEIIKTLHGKVEGAKIELTEWKSEFYKS